MRAIQEALTLPRDLTDVWVCPPGDPAALADALVHLRHDDNLRRSIAARGHARFHETARLDVLASDLSAMILELV